MRNSVGIEDQGLARLASNGQKVDIRRGSR